MPPYAKALNTRFKWLPAGWFVEQLAADLLADARALIGCSNVAETGTPLRTPSWRNSSGLATQQHGKEKLLVFTQFATPLAISRRNWPARHSASRSGTGDSANPTELPGAFAPDANGKRHLCLPSPGGEGPGVRKSCASDRHRRAVGSQNLQDCAIIVNYDLPWAIIRLIQRAGRVDRIGQQSDTILCYSFVPAMGWNGCSAWRARVRQRLIENREVVGSDEIFFDDDPNEGAIRDLYTEMSGIPGRRGRTEVDLASYAYHDFGRTPPTPTHRWLPNRGLAQRGLRDQGPTRPRRSRPRACWCTCAPAKATTPWPGSTSRAPLTQSQLTI